MPIARNQILITIDGVKDLSEKGIAFRCRYELVGFTDDGKPRYQCIYLREGEPEAILVSTRITPDHLEPSPRPFPRARPPRPSPAGERPDEVAGGPACGR